MRKSNDDKRPPPLPGIVRINREEAARGQLETAIWLWFHEGDIAAIHTLAVAAQGLLSASCRDAGISFGRFYFTSLRNHLADDDALRA